MLARQQKKQGGAVKDDSPALSFVGPDGATMGVEGKRKAMHLGRPGRKRGGRVGAELSPLSSAAKCID